MKKDEKIFVTGGTGLVGSSIVKRLIEGGYTSIITNYHIRPPDVFLTEHRPQYEDGRLRVIKLDLFDQQKVSDFFAEENPDYVFLAAALVGGIMANNTYRADFIYSNLQIQNVIIHQSYLNKVKKLLFLGSSCIYPRDCPQPMKEEYLLRSPLEYTNEPYAIAKIAGIRMCESYNLQYNTNYLSVMPTNLFGPKDNFDLETSHVLPALVRKVHLSKLLSEDRVDDVRSDLGVKTKKEARQILEQYGISEGEVTIWGSGEPRREFLYSSDLADACVYIMENVNFEDLIDRQTDIRNTHINIGSGKDLSIRELAETIKEVLEFKGCFVFDRTKPDGTMKKLLDVEKLSGLGWKSKIGLKEGIKRVYKNYLIQSNKSC